MSADAAGSEAGHESEGIVPDPLVKEIFRNADENSESTHTGNSWSLRWVVKLP